MSALLVVLIALLLTLACGPNAQAAGIGYSLTSPKKPAPPPTTPAPDLQAIISAFPDGLTPSQIEAIADAADPALARQVLRNRLEQAGMADRAAQAEPAETALAFYGRRLHAVVGAFERIPDTGLLPLLTFLALTATLSVIASMLVRQLLTRSHLGYATTSLLIRRLVPQTVVGDGHLYSSFRRRVSVIVASLVAMGVYCASTVGLYFALQPEHPDALSGVEFLLREGVIFWVAIIALDLVLMPRSADLRLLPLTNHTARILYRAMLWTACLMLVPSWLTLLTSGFALPLDTALALWLPVSILPFAYLIGAIIVHRRLAEDVLIHLGFKQEEDVVAAVLAFLLTSYLVGLWLLVVDTSLRGGTSAIVQAMLSLAIVLAIPLAAHIIRLMFKRFFAPLKPTSADAANGDPYIRRMMRAVWVALCVLGLVGVAYLWGIDARQAGFADYSLRVLTNIAVIILLGYVGWALFQRWVDHRLEFANADDDPGHAQRLQTLLPLFRNFVRVALVVMIAMIVLASMGIEIGPLIAGAGVVGIAIGLGAQATIADILAGVFFLLEDSFRVGDYVEVGTVRGTVEGISLRSLKLRHHRGMLHTLPFGQIKSLTNCTRDWALMRLEFRLPLGTDLEAVRKLVKKIGQDLAADPEMGPDFIQPPKSQGVRRIDGNALVIGVKFITKPGRQFVIRREAYHRILRAFIDNGINLMGTGVVVRVEDATGITAAVAGAGAVEAVESIAAKPAA